MDSKQAFKKFQKLILLLINNPIGKRYFGIQDEVGSKKILAITPNSYVVQEGDNYKQVIRTYDHFEKKLSKLLKYSSLLVLAPAAPQLAFALTTETYFSGPGDGRVARTAQASWANAHDNATGTVADSGTADNIFAICQPAADAGWRIDRGFVPFDTSAIPDSVTLSSATFSIMPSGITNPDSLSIHLITTTQADPTTLATSDFGSIGTTEQATAIALASMSVDVYAVYTLNATGISNVSKTGYTKFGIRTTHDLNNVSCTDSVNHTTQGTFYSSEHTGTSKDPLLTITYPSSGSSSAGTFSYFM